MKKVTKAKKAPAKKKTAVKVKHLAVKKPVKKVKKVTKAKKAPAKKKTARKATRK